MRSRKSDAATLLNRPSRRRNGVQLCGPGVEMKMSHTKEIMHIYGREITRLPQSNMNITLVPIMKTFKDYIIDELTIYYFH